ncbi:MAG: hypothetical protein AAF281_05965, partial [Pseudomonadota bacterium]
AVIMGIIDDGIALTNTRFLRRLADGTATTRAKFFWNQDASRPEGSVPFGRDWGEDALLRIFAAARGADGYPSAERVDRALEMDRILTTCAQHGTHVMDLATGYDCDDDTPNTLGEIPAEMSTRRPIVAVQLSRIASRQSSGAYMATYVTHALDYILERAVALQPDTGPPVPLVINFSYGVFAGSLSGNDQMEEWIDAAVDAMWARHKIPVWVTLPAGNSYLSQTSGLRPVARGAEMPTAPHPDFTLRKEVESKAPTVLELIWPEERGLPPEALGLDPAHLGRGPRIGPEERQHILDAQKTVTSDLALHLWPPHARDPIAATGAAPQFYQGVPLLQTIGGRAVCVGMVYHERLVSLDQSRDYPAAPGAGPRLYAAQSKMTLILAQSLFEQSLDTAAFQQTPVSVTPGFWRIALARQGDTRVTDQVMVRCQRGDTPFGFRPFGRQSQLEDPHFQVYTPEGRITQTDDPAQWVTRDGTISAIATGRATIRVGSFRLADLVRRRRATNRIVDGGASSFSSGGYRAPLPGWTDWPPRGTVDVAAASEINHALPGVMAAGTHSGSAFRFAGTSSAAPQIARWIAFALSTLATAPDRDILRWLAGSGMLPYFAESLSEPRTGKGLLLAPRVR